MSSYTLEHVSQPSGHLTDSPAFSYKVEDTTAAATTTPIGLLSDTLGNILHPRFGTAMTTAMRDNDKVLSGKILESADAAGDLVRWSSEMASIVDEASSLVDEYSEVIDGFASAFSVVGFVWNIYSSMEKAKENAAQQQAMVSQITQAVGGMITRSTAEISRLIDEKELRGAVVAVKALQDGFRRDVQAHAKTWPLAGDDLLPLVLLMHDARQIIVTLHAMIKDRAERGDGAATIIIYRNLQAAVQCRLLMDKSQRGLTQAVIADAQEDIIALLGAWGWVLFGLQTMSDLSFSQGVIHFHAGGHGRPEFTRYTYRYKGKVQPVAGSNLAVVSQAFLEARQRSRDEVIPQGVQDWGSHLSGVISELSHLKE